MYFASFGEEVLSAISSFASQASSALIDEIRIPLLTCLTIYFLIKGYLITYGRIDSPLSDFILTAGKILLVTYFGLNALNYVNDVIPAIRGLENMLVGILRLPVQEMSTRKGPGRPLTTCGSSSCSSPTSPFPPRGKFRSYLLSARGYRFSSLGF